MSTNNRSQQQGGRNRNWIVLVLGLGVVLMIGLGVGLFANQWMSGAHWYAPTSLLDADFANARYWNGTQTCADEASFLSAIAGTRAGDTITITPKPVGEELLANGSFNTDISGWAASPGFVANTSLSHESKHLRNDIASAGGSRFSAQVAVEEGKTYAFRGTLLDASGVTSSALNVSGNANLYSASAITSGLDIGVSEVAYFGATRTEVYVGGNTNNTTTGGYATWDDFSVKEIAPLSGHNHLAFAGIVKGTTPTSTGGDKVAFQADTNDTRNRVRLVWGSDTHLHLTTKAGNAEQVNLDLGAVPVATDFVVEFSVSPNDMFARLNDGKPVLTGSADQPALAYIRIGSSFAGETWDGSIDRITLFNAPRGEQYKIAMWGDSLTANMGLALSGYFDAGDQRPVYNGGINGENAGEIAARMLADTQHRDRIVILWDRNNTGYPNEDFLANMAAMVARVRERHERFIVISDINKTDGTEDDGSAWRTAQDERNATLAASYPDNYLDVVDALDDPLLRQDGLHLNTAGYDVLGPLIVAFIEGKGW